MESERDREKALREHVRYLLRGGGAHIDIRSALADFPLALINTKLGNLPYTPWQVVEHMRIAQWDILEFSRNAQHVSPKFPNGYWPEPSINADEKMWNETIEKLRDDLTQMEDLVANYSTDLLARIPHGTKQTILREALVVADHNAYHLGALMTMKKMGAK